jgi:hypothetical protein
MLFEILRFHVKKTFFIFQVRYHITFLNLALSDSNISISISFHGHNVCNIYGRKLEIRNDVR